MSLSYPKQDHALQAGTAAIILTYADIYEKQITKPMRKEIERLLRETSTRQCDIATIVVEQIGLPPESQPSIVRVIGRIAKAVLTDEERKVRHVECQRCSQREVVRSIVEYGTYGRAGGHKRAQQYQESGVNGAGHRLWSDEEDASLLKVLKDPENLYNTDRHFGKPNYKKVQNAYNNLHPESHRSIIALRKRGRELLVGQEE